MLRSLACYKSTDLYYFKHIKVARYINKHKFKPLIQESRKQNVMQYEQTRVTTCVSGNINEMTCIYDLTIHCMSIADVIRNANFWKNSALYLIISCGDLCWNFAHIIVLQKSFNITKPFKCKFSLFWRLFAQFQWKIVRK